MTYYVTQDGADFYVYADSECSRLLMTRTAPFPVKDSDMEAATLARKWFTELGNAAAQRNTIFVGN